MGDSVEFTQKGNGLEIFPTTVDIGQPLTLATRVIVVKHRSNGIDAQAIEVEFFQPVDGAGKQEVLDLVATIIIDQRAPVTVLAAARVLVLVQGRTVKTGKTVRVARKVCRDPVKQDANAVLMTVVNKETEIIRFSKAAGRCEIAGRLVTPGGIERVLGDRQ